MDTPRHKRPDDARTYEEDLKYDLLQHQGVALISTSEVNIHRLNETMQSQNGWGYLAINAEMYNEEQIAEFIAQGLSTYLADRKGNNNPSVHTGVINDALELLTQYQKPYKLSIYRTTDYVPSDSQDPVSIQTAKVEIYRKDTTLSKPAYAELAENLSRFSTRDRLAEMKKISMKIGTAPALIVGIASGLSPEEISKHFIAPEYENFDAINGPAPAFNFNLIEQLTRLQDNIFFKDSKNFRPKLYTNNKACQEFVDNWVDTNFGTEGGKLNNWRVLLTPDQFGMFEESIILYFETVQELMVSMDKEGARIKRPTGHDFEVRSGYITNRPKRTNIARVELKDNPHNYRIRSADDLLEHLTRRSEDL